MTTNETVTPEVAKSTEPASVKPPAKRASPKKPAAKPTARTLGDLADAYIKFLEKQGRSNATCASYAADIKVALAVLGEGTAIDTLTPAAVQAYFECDRVTKLRSGKPKSQLSIDKTRRVLRQALVFAVERKWLKVAPLPAVDAK